MMDATPNCFLQWPTEVEPAEEYAF